MAHSLSPHSLVARHAATVPPHPAVLPHPRIAARTARARRSITAAAATVAAGATLLLTPRAAQASDPLYEACLDAVHVAALKCLDSTDNPLGDFACMWAGGLGYLGCAIIEAIRQLLPGGLNIT